MIVRLVLVLEQMSYGHDWSFDDIVQSREQFVYFASTDVCRRTGVFLLHLRSPLALARTSQ
jgi:hypothetical protein